MGTPELDNVLSAFAEHAKARPDQDALLITSPSDGSVTERVTYGELLSRAETFAAGLREARMRPRQTVIVAGPLSVDFYALAIAIVGSGLTLGLIDGRLDRRRMLNALRSARPRAIVSVDAVLRRWPAVPPLWRAHRYAVDAGEGEGEGRARLGFGVHALAQLTERGRVPLTPGRRDDPAIVSFTSGSSGRAKGVVRTNGILLAQHQALAANVPFVPGDVDMTCFPAVVLHSLASGVTTVLPPVDLRAPATVDPALAVLVMREHGVTSLSGAPAFVSRIADHVAAAAGGSAESTSAAPRLRQIVLGGAPVSRALCRQLATAFPEAIPVVVYGSTEAEPIAHVSGREILAEAEFGSWREPAGLLVGAPVAGVRVEVVTLPERVTERVTEAWIEERRSAVGEVVVYGPNVSRVYVGDRNATTRTKLRLRDGAVWHRTGDLARWDADGRLRLLGRVGESLQHRGTTLHPLPLEARLAAVPGVRRAAVVGVRGTPVLAVALDGDGKAARSAVVARLEEFGLGALPVRVLAEIPVDARHQSKVDRPALVRALEGRSDTG